MMFFNEVTIFINGSGVVANTAALSSSNTVNAIKILGQKRQHPTSVDGAVTHKFDVSYVPDLKSDQIIPFIEATKTGDHSQNTSPFVIQAGGISGSYYLNSYSLSLGLHDITQARASFTCHHDLSGQLSGSYPSFDGVPFSGDNFSHAWTILFNKQNIPTTNNIYGFDYSFDTQTQVIYPLGSRYPTQIINQGSREAIKLKMELYKNILYTGQSATGYLEDIDTVSLQSLSLIKDQALGGHEVHQFDIPISGMVVTTNEVSHNVNDLSTVLVEFWREY